MVSLGETMLDLNKRLVAAKTPREVFAEIIGATDREIDRIVYPPHGLPAEGIAVVDGPAFRAARIRRRFLSRNEGWAAEDYR